MTTVSTAVDGLTDESLTAHTEPVDGVGWPPPESFPVRECLLIVLNEEGTIGCSPSGISTL
jgi:hypothetical protein